uniref:GST N-terminal domain-containing protein n=1 Tax=Panagrolaimus sp. JU765 TaxID=591449 RepID=A0AC34RSU9_9BILA
MVKYILQSFKTNGRAGGIRLFMDYLKLPHEDEIVELDEWPKIKESTPFGKLPVLISNEENFILPETLAIYRFLAMKHGGFPEKLEEQVLCDSFGHHIRDYLLKVGLFSEAKS